MCSTIAAKAAMRRARSSRRAALSERDLGDHDIAGADTLQAQNPFGSDRLQTYRPPFDQIEPVGFVPGGGLYEAALADFIACATNRYTGVWAAAPALVQLEANVLRWLTDWMGYPDQALRIPMPGGTRSLNLANSAAVAVYEGLRQNSNWSTPAP